MYFEATCILDSTGEPGLVTDTGWHIYRKCDAYCNIRSKQLTI